MKAITYLIELQEPLLATALQGDPNSSITLPYISGSMVRGMVIGSYLRKHNGVSDPARDPDCRRLFFNGSTRYLHAYPYDPDIGVRWLPTPRSLRRFKGKQATEARTSIFDASNKDWDCNEQRKQEREKEDSLKSVDTPFCHFSSEEITFYQPERTLTIHTQRAPKRGRSHKDEGEIFRYEALAAGQWFQGVILLDDEQDEQIIGALLNQAETCWLGRSRSAGYGRASIVEVQTHRTWREVGNNSVPSLETDENCTMTLLSDTLLYDDDGQPVTAMNKGLLEDILGVSVRLVDTHTFTSSVHHGGFNRTWRLPLPQSYMLAAGSVITFQLDTRLDAEIVNRLEAQGIGARRAEGFGRIVFNWRNRNTMELTSNGKGNGTKPHCEEEPLNEVEQQMARRMARRLLEADIEHAILGYVKNTDIDKAPQSTQLNRIRTLARQYTTRGSEGAQTVLAQFSQFKKAARQQFERARISRSGSQESLDRWIRNLLEDPLQSIKKSLNTQPRKVADVQVTLEDDPDLAASTALRLLAAMMEKTVHDAQQKEQRRKEQSA